MALVGERIGGGVAQHVGVRSRAKPRRKRQKAIMQQNGPDLAGGIGVEAGTCSLGKSVSRLSTRVCIVTRPFYQHPQIVVRSCGVPKKP
jgi:hypothetical protein